MLRQPLSGFLFQENIPSIPSGKGVCEDEASLARTSRGTLACQRRHLACLGALRLVYRIRGQEEKKKKKKKLNVDFGARESFFFYCQDCRKENPLPKSTDRDWS